MSGDRAKDVITRCCRCGGTNVQVAMWVRPNGLAVVDGGEWLHDDQDYAVQHGYQWCEDCGEHTYLVTDTWAEDEAYADAERRAGFIRGFKAWVAFDGKPDGAAERIGWQAAADINERGGGERPTAREAIEACIAFFEREDG